MTTRERLQKSFEHFQPSDIRLIFDFIESEAQMFPVKTLCRVLRVSKSAYYACLKKDCEQHSCDEARAVREVFHRHRRRYGSRRIREEMKAEGNSTGRHKMRRLMPEQGLRAIQPKPFVPKTTDSGHNLGYCENLLIGMKLPPSKPNEAIVGDITYLPLEDGSFAYLASWEDLFSRLVMGWEVEEHLQEELIVEAFEKGLRRRGSLLEAIVHSDRGGQYAGSRFRSLLKAAGCRQSMSRAATQL
ncbi:MAG: IS3 family transposase [Pyrinomonadaceae bacterium]